ncbi:MAG: hypothetical protein NUV84_05660 [Candidatus Uhrbacteria bacterium]|nr:hypothetical protein [Candidatus Uhrbacteria bacterium]
MNGDHSIGEQQRQQPEIFLSDPNDVWSGFIKHFNWFFGLVVGALLIGFVTMLLMVAQLIIEAYRFNSSFYRESTQIKIQEELIQNTVEQQEQVNDVLNQMKADIEILKQR